MRSRNIVGCSLALVVVVGCGGSASPGYSESSSGAEEEGVAAEGTSDSGGERATVQATTTVETTMPGPPPPSQQQQDAGEPMVALQGDFSELMNSSRELEEALATPDCGLARNLRDRICDLSTRICEIADEHPGEVDAGERCEDGRGRCERASRDIDGSCE